MKTGIAGALGGILAILLLIKMDVHSFWPLIVFWPTSILGFGYNGGEPTTGFIIGTLEFSGNALLYGALGWHVGKALSLSRAKFKG
jgi:hypothetical protein